MIEEPVSPNQGPQTSPAGYERLGDDAGLEVEQPGSPASVPDAVLQAKSEDSDAEGEHDEFNDDDGWEPLGGHFSDEDQLNPQDPQLHPVDTQLGDFRRDPSSIAALEDSLPTATHHVLAALPSAVAVSDFSITAEHSKAIMTAMRGVSLQYKPAWAVAVAEEAWREDVRRRLQQRRQPGSDDGGGDNSALHTSV